MNRTIEAEPHAALALSPAEQQAIALTPMGLLQSAILQGAGIDTIERLAKLQREMVEYEAQVAFNGAMHRAQANMGRITADATNPQTHSKYASYAQIDRALRPVYSHEGFSLSFDTAEAGADIVRVLCYVSHEDGHTRTYRVDMPADGKGAKGGDVMTKTHASGAAMSYGMRYLLKMIFNVAVGEDDTDGNLGTKLPVSTVEEWITAIRESPDMDTLKRNFAEAYKKAQAANDRTAMQAYMTTKEARKKEL